MYIRTTQMLADLLRDAEIAHKLYEHQLNQGTAGPCTTCEPWPEWYAKWIHAEMMRLSERTTKYDTMSMEYALSNFAPEISPTQSIASQRQDVLAGAHPWPAAPSNEENASLADLGCLGGC
jgi:hypothetical protein